MHGVYPLLNATSIWLRAQSLRGAVALAVNCATDSSWMLRLSCLIADRVREEAHKEALVQSHQMRCTTGFTFETQLTQPALLPG